MRRKREGEGRRGRGRGRKEEAGEKKGAYRQHRPTVEKRSSSPFPSEPFLS